MDRSFSNLAQSKRERFQLESGPRCLRTTPPWSLVRARLGKYGRPRPEGTPCDREVLSTWETLTPLVFLNTPEKEGPPEHKVFLPHFSYNLHEVQ